MADSDSGSEFDGFSDNEIGGINGDFGDDWSDLSLSDWEVIDSDDSGDENDFFRQENEPLVWQEETHDVNVTDYQHENRVGPNVNLPPDATVLDYFFLLFPQKNFEVIARQTNLYAQQSIAVRPDPRWYPTDENGREMRAFFAMNILMGLHNVPAYEWLWSEDFRMNCPGISSVMPKARYEKLQQYLHLVDNTEAHPRGHPDFDPLFKVRPFLDDTVRRFYRYYYPHRELSVDEAMVGFKGRLSMKNYCPAKPTKWGIKVWMCCDPANGYTCNFQVYTGRRTTLKKRVWRTEL